MTSVEMVILRIAHGHVALTGWGLFLLIIVALLAAAGGSDG